MLRLAFTGNSHINTAPVAGNPNAKIVSSPPGVCRRAAGCQQLLQSAVSTIRPSTAAAAPVQHRRAASTLLSTAAVLFKPIGAHQSGSLLSRHPSVLALMATAPTVRTVTKFSLRKGKRKTVKAVLKRFMRLDWGGWIRTRQGRHKKMWRKTAALKRRLRQHVFVNGTQAHLLDKMVTPFWRRPRHYVDDPYRPYHSREEFSATRRQPLKY